MSSAMSACARRDVQGGLGRARVLGLVAVAVVVGVGLDDPADEQRRAVERVRHGADLMEADLVARPDRAAALRHPWPSCAASERDRSAVPHGRGDRHGGSRAAQRPAHEHAVAGAVGLARKASAQHPGVSLATGASTAGAPNVVAARAPAGTSSSTHEKG